MADIQITYIFFAIMAVFFGAGLICIATLFRLGIAFKKAHDYLKKDGAAEKVKRWLTQSDVGDYNFFNVKALKNTLEEYRQQTLRNTKLQGASPYNDITKYFHATYINSICGGAFCDLIPGFMTGLGLLGTFVGLTMGISGLDLEHTDLLLAGINGLVDGMNTAFYTSILGVTLSLFFSLLHKFALGSTLRWMDLFIDIFQEKNLDASDDSPENMFLSYQQQQSAAMTDLADKIAATMSSCMTELFLPLSTKMEKTIDDFAQVATQRQLEGLDLIVEKFITKMNKSLKGQFQALGTAIQETCEWQKTTVAQMQTMIDRICITSSEIEQVNELSQKTVAELHSYMEKINQLHTAMHRKIELTAKQIETANAINEKNAAYIKTMHAYEGQIARLADTVKREAEAANQVIDSLSESCQAQVKSLSDAVHAEISLLSEESAKLYTENRMQLNKLATAVSMQVQASAAAANKQSEALTQATNSFISFIQHQNEVTEEQTIAAVQRASATLDAGLTNMTQQLREASMAVYKATNMVPQAIAKSQQQQDIAMNALVQQMQQYITTMQRLADEIQEKLNSERRSDR